MKIVIERFGGGPVTFEQFADANGFEMFVSERQGTRSRGQFYAHFKRVEVIDGAMLSSDYGDGSTPEEAIADYARKIAGRRLVFAAYTPERREVDAPNSFLPVESPSV